MLRVGSRFGDYVIEGVLGIGGMGEVYVARHPRLPRSDALKVLNTRFAVDDEFRRRFEREADTVAALNHPHIVAIYDRGETDNRLWIAFQLIDGTDLSNVVHADRPLSTADVARITTDVADALDYANSCGLIHRDVKPANILLSNSGHVLLTGFGIARGDSGDTQLTAAGSALGTLDYASPEQLRGLDLDGRSDQYSLACTVYHLLTGRAPHNDRNGVAVIARHLEQPFPTVREMRPDLPPAVDTVLAAAASKNPAGRFRTSTEFANALRSALLSPATPHPGEPATQVLKQLPPQRDLHRGGSSGPPPRPPYFGNPTPNGDRATPPPPHYGQPPLSAKKSQKKWWLVGGAAALVIVIAIAAVTAVVMATSREGDPEVSSELAALRHDPSTPLSPSLAAQPTRPKWTYSPDPSGIDTYRHEIMAGTDKFTVATPGFADNAAGVLDILDAQTGQALHRVTIPQTDGDAVQDGSCVTTETTLACSTLSRVVFIDLNSGAITGTYKAQGGESSSIDRVVTAGEGFVVTGHSSGLTNTVAATDNRGTVRWQTAGMSSKVYPDAKVVEVDVEGAPDSTYARDFQLRRVSDGAIIYRADNNIGGPAWAPTRDGYVVAGPNGPDFCDTNGKVVASASKSWEPLPTLADSAAPALPILGRAGATRSPTQLAVANPETGTILWQRGFDGRPDTSPSTMAYGVGTAVGVQLLYTPDSDRRFPLWLDIYSAGQSVSVSDRSNGGTLLASDGTRFVTLRNKGECSVSGCDKELRAYGADGNYLWTLTTAGSVRQYGGLIYADDRRIV